jgi:HEAT repeat protein
MVRSLRRVSPLVGALRLRLASACAIAIPCALVTGALGMGALGIGGALVGCSDEQAVETHIGRLKDPVKRPAAVKRLILFFEDAMTKDDKKLDGPNVKPLLDKIIEPLAQVATGGEVDQRAQGELLKFLADTRDARAVPALAKALADYRPDDKRGELYDSQMADVVRAVGKMKAKEASKPLFDLFLRLRASTPKAQYKQFYRILNEAMLAVSDPAWESQLLGLLDKPIQWKDPKAKLDEEFWQTTAAQVLGLLGSKQAVGPLMKVALSPFKGGVGTTSIMALIKIGKPAIDPAIKLLGGEDAELKKYAEDEYLRFAKETDQKIDKKVEDAAKGAYLATAAIILANIGRGECIEPMIAALEKGDPVTKATVGMHLYKLPVDPRVTDAFKKVYETTPASLFIPPQNPAKELLVDAAGGFFDAGMVPWLVKNAIDLKGEESDTAPVRQKVLEVAMKLARAQDWDMLQRLAAIEVKEPQPQTIGKAFEKELKLAKELLDACGDKADCYVAKITDGEAQTETKQFLGIKSVYMAGALGGEGVKAKLVEALPRISNAAVRFVTGVAIDRIASKGDKDLADKIQAMVDKNRESLDEQKIRADEPLKTVLYRLRARAE